MKTARKQLRFNVDIVDHCNLNCIGCGHFSPLAKEKFLSVESFQKDCERLHYLTGGNIERLELMGGEPLLHPDIIRIMEIARCNFDGEINICTNGILVEKQSEEFFESCQQLNIGVAITLYPIRLNWERIDKLSDNFGFKLLRVSTKNHDCRIWFKNHRDLTGSQDCEANFTSCRWGNNCIILENGRLATCVMPFKTKFYNEYYNTNTFKIPETDSIDIYRATDIKEVLDFLAKPIATCRYCLPNNDEVINWTVSNKDVEEWS